jgi:hypothetical protein
MAKAKIDAPPADARTYLGRRISKRTFALHKGTAIVRVLEDPDVPPEAIVTFTVRAKMTGIAHSFLATGTVEEASVLEYDGDSFSILGVEIPEPDPQLNLDGEGDPEKGLSIAEAAAQEDKDGGLD